MTAGFAFGFTVEVYRDVAPKDRWGDSTSAPHHTISGCAVYPASSGNVSREQLDARVTITEGLVLLSPPGSDLKATDEVQLPAVALVPAQYRGKRYKVDGEPGSWQSPFTGWAPGMQTALKDVKG